MRLTQLLSAIGDDNIEFQRLSTSFRELKRSLPNRVTYVSFGTPGQLVNGILDGTKEALIVWVDKARLSELEGKP